MGNVAKSCSFQPWISSSVYCFLFSSVTLHIVNEKNCSGQDFTFSCEDAEMRHLTWSFSYFSDIPVVQFIPALTLSRTYTRITTTDSTSGPSPSFITILNITAADNGGRVQCSVGDAAFSKVMLLSIRKCRRQCSWFHCPSMHCPNTTLTFLIVI